LNGARRTADFYTAPTMRVTDAPCRPATGDTILLTSVHGGSILLSKFRSEEEFRAVENLREDRMSAGLFRYYYLWLTL
jgi:hypothetical protein